MKILIAVILLLVGFVALIKGADLFVDGSASLATKFKIPGVIIGLTIVAMGTSAPELSVSISSAINKANGLCLGNVIGSNIFNMLVVLGVCSVISPIGVDKSILKRDYPLSIIFTIIVAVMSGAMVFFKGNIASVGMKDTVGSVTRVEGIVLLVLFVMYVAFTVYVALKNRTEGDKIESYPLWKCIIFIIVGIAAIVIGGNLVVDNARVIALSVGMSETLVGLTIVAIGTSLPELVTSIVASSKGQNGMAIGNVVGSNIFNILLILGSSAAINSINIAFESVIDIVILLVFGIIAYVFCLTGKKVNRIEGMIMILMYISYTAFAIIR